MKQSKKISRKVISVLLAMLMVFSCFSGVSLTAFAAPTETLLTKITPTGIDTYSESVAGVVTVTLSDISRYNGSWAFGGTVTVAPKEGYTITKCIFNARKGAVEDTEAPFSIDVSSATYVNSVEVYGYQAAGATTLTAETTTWENGDYVVPAGGVTISGHITVKGIVNLTLTEGATLTANMGITLGQNARLNVSGKGVMVVKGSNGNANSTVAGTGKLVLKSGTLTATGGNGQSFSSGNETTGNTGGVAINGTVAVNGGTLVATGGNGGSLNAHTISQLNGGTGGAAIGGAVTINGGTVTATGGNGGSITITNYGDSNKGGNGGAAIGGAVTINGGTLTATKGDNGTLNIKNGSPNYAGTGSAGYDGTLTLGANVKLYEGTDDTGTVLDGNDSDSRVYSGEKKANMYAYGSDVDAVADKSELNDAITVAENWYGRIKNNTDYTDIASALKTATDTAKAVADNDEAGQDVVDTATQNLITAILTAEASISMGTTWEEETYVVPIFGETIADHITVTGTVNLILTKGATLTVNAGITLNDGATLNVSGDGAMVINGTNGNANSTVAGTGELILKSGTLTANGGNGGSIGNDGYQSTSGAGGAAINGAVIVKGGTLTATGGTGGSIGNYSMDCTSGAGGAAINGAVTVNGGTLTATDGAKGTGGRTYGCTFGAGGAGYSGTLTLGKGVKLYNGTDNTGTVLDDNDSSSRVYEGTKKAKMYAYGPDIAQGPDKTDLNTAITAAETLYDSIKDDTNYSTIASTLKTAIDAAKEVADSETADQDAVDAAKTDITTAKTNAEAAKKDVDDTNAANAVITKINALPATESVTSENKDAIEAARAAYNALTDDQKKKVDADTLKKLTDAEAALKDVVDTETAQTATETINSLPDADKVTTADKEKIEAARKAYNDLTDDQKKKVSDDTLKKLTDAEDALAAATVSEEIGTLPDADKITAENKAAIEAAKKAYDELTDEQKQYVDKTTKEKLETAVTALDIALLPAADEITAANKQAIEAARKAYDALSDEQKSELGTAAKEKLEAAEAALAIAVLPAADDVTSENKEAIEAARKAYNALNDEQKASVGTAAKEKLEAAEAALAIALLPTPSDVSAEDKEAIETARKAYDALNDKQKASVGKTAKEKLEAAEAALAIAELPDTDEITTEDKAAIEAARKAYNALNDAQKELVGDDAKAKLEAAEVALTKALVEALPAADKVTAEDKDAIEEARKAYNALTDEQKASVGEDAKAKLEAAEAALAIAELPAADKVTAEDKAAIEAAAKAYNALTDEQKEMVGEVAKAKLEAAKAALAIALLPEAEKVTSADKANIEAARKAYDALTDEQKSELGTAAKEKLEAAEVKLTKELISELPKASKVTTADATDVAAAKETYDKLTDEQKEKITATEKAKLDAVVQALSDAEVYDVRTMINNLPAADEVKAADKEAIEAARKAYDELTDEQKAFVGETAKSALEADEAALAIAKLPAKSDVTAEDKDAIEVARKTYDALTLAQKEELGENAKKKLDNAEVGLVERQLEALPTEVTGSEREAIEAARKAYDALTDEQKASVNPETLKKLTDAEAVIDAAEKEAKDTAAANAVSDTINAIPAASEVTPENKDAIEAARKAYEELTDDQKAKVTPETLKKLTDAETALKEAIDTAAAKDATDKINAVPETDKVTTKDEAAIDAARKAYDALTEDQKAKIAPETLKKLTDAEEELTVAKNNVAAFNANKAVQKKAADKLTLATDSATGKKLIANAKAALDNLAYDESKTPDQNSAAQKAIVTKLASDLKAQRAWESEVARAKLNSNARGTSNKKGYTVKWGAAPNADKYEIYAQYCDGKSPYKKIATVKGNVNSYSITKLGGKKVNTSKCIRTYIVAYRLVNGKYVKVAQSIAMHIAGANNKKHTNAKAITVKNDSLTLKVNKSATLKPSIVRENSKKKMIDHTATFRYQSSNTRVAKVDANGKITAVGKGTCTIFVFANNGKLKSVKITVK